MLLDVLHSILECARQLVGARCILDAAGQSSELARHIGGLLALRHLGDAYSVARTAAYEAEAVNTLLVVEVKLYGLRASALGGVCNVSHNFYNVIFHLTNVVQFLLFVHTILSHCYKFLHNRLRLQIVCALDLSLGCSQLCKSLQSFCERLVVVKE